jgi:NAD(P)-dependent dehydrogenase (short-subunit alcohol dehydrogenase family)
MGPVHTLVYNAGTGTWGTIEEIDPSILESSFRVNTLGLLLTTKRGHSTDEKPRGRQHRRHRSYILATRSWRAQPDSRPRRAAQRSLTESMARPLWPANIHVSLVIIDGVVDLPRTRAMMKDKPDDVFIAPDDLADTAFHLTVQPRSTWSIEVEARPYKESW